MGAYVVRTSSLNDKLVANFCIILQSCSSFFFCLHGQPELFASDSPTHCRRLAESGLALFLVVFYFLISAFALFALRFSFLSEHFFLAAQNLNLSMRVFGPRDSAYAVNLTYDRHTDTYISPEISIEHPSVGLASLAQLETDEKINN